MIISCDALGSEWVCVCVCMYVCVPADHRHNINGSPDSGSSRGANTICYFVCSYSYGRGKRTNACTLCSALHTAGPEFLTQIHERGKLFVVTMQASAHIQYLITRMVNTVFSRTFVLWSVLMLTLFLISVLFAVSPFILVTSLQISAVDAILPLEWNNLQAIKVSTKPVHKFTVTHNLERNAWKMIYSRRSLLAWLTSM